MWAKGSPARVTPNSVRCVKSDSHNSPARCSCRKYTSCAGPALARQRLIRPLQSSQLPSTKRSGYCRCNAAKIVFALQPWVRTQLHRYLRPYGSKAILPRPPVSLTFSFRSQAPSSQVLGRRSSRPSLPSRPRSPASALCSPSCIASLFAGLAPFRKALSPPAPSASSNRSQIGKNNCRQPGTLIVTHHCRKMLPSGLSPPCRNKEEFIKALARIQSNTVGRESKQSRRSLPWLETVATATGAFIPIIPFFFMTGIPAIIFAAVISLLASLSLWAAARSSMTVRTWWSTGLELTAFGAAEGILTFSIGMGLGQDSLASSDGLCLFCQRRAVKQPRSCASSQWPRFPAR